MRFGIRDGVRQLLHLRPRSSETIHREMDDELRFYLEARVEQLVARGVPEHEARAEAIQRLGDSFADMRSRLHHSAATRERRMLVHEWLDDLRQDLRYAARGLVHHPGFSLVAVGTLAIGIGATTAIFSAVNALLLRRLPYRDPDALMAVSLVVPGNEQRPATNDMVWSYPKFQVFRDAQQVFSAITLYAGDQFNVTGGEAERIRGETTDAQYFPLLGVALARGSNFNPEDDKHGGAPRVAIISDALWQRRFNADVDIIGQSLNLSGEPYAILGVAPPGFAGLTGQADVWIPITTRPPADIGPEQAQSHEFSMIARRRPGVSTEQAAAAARALGPRVNAAFPGRIAREGWGAQAIPLNNTRIAPLVRRSLLVPSGAVALVLLIVCVNLTSLLIGRARARRREIAIRLSLGAGRARLVRLLLAESLLLAVIGGGASLALAWWGTRLLSQVNPTTTPRLARIGGLGSVTFSSARLDTTALLFTLGVAVGIGLLFGLAPALRSTGESLTGALKEGAGDGRGRAGTRALTGRRILVVTEVALALTLLAGSGLMIRSLARLLAVGTGFDARLVLTLRLNVSPAGYVRDSMPAFYASLVERLAALPGVAQVGLGDCIPLNGSCNITKIEFVDRPNSDASPPVGVRWATASLFATLRIPLRRGRLFIDADRVGAPKVMLVNEAAAREFWPNEDPIGKRVRIFQGGFADGAEVVGVVGNVREWPDSLTRPVAYLSYAQSPTSRMVAFVRSSGDPLALLPAVRRAVHDLAPDSPVYDVRTMTERVAAAMAQARYSAIVLALFAGVALVLAVVGIYGVLSFAVLQRTREIGIRMALGADRSGVVRMIIGEGAVLAAAGVAFGLIAALWLTRVLRTLLYGVAPSDPVTYVSIVALLGAAAVFASWIPARRAARVDPNVALRAE